MERISINELSKSISEEIENRKEYKESPYHFHANMRYRKYNEKDCSRHELRFMESEGLLTIIHHKIITILDDYTYLNSFLLSKILSIEMGEDISNDTCKNLLSCLYSKGLIVYYILFHNDEVGKEYGSPKYYTLSNSGAKYSTIIKSRNCRYFYRQKRDIFSITQMLNIMAENQFAIYLQSQYPTGKSALKFFDFNGQLYYKTGVRMYTSFQVAEEKRLSIYTFAVREHPDATKQFIKQLEQIVAFSKKQNINNYSVIVISDMADISIKCERLRKTYTELNTMEVCYIADTSIITESCIFDRLYEVVPSDDYSETKSFSLSIS